MVVGRHAPRGHGDRVHWSFWAAAAVLATARFVDLPLGQPASIALATMIFIGGGLPHGAYDIALLRRAAVLDRSALSLAIGGYVAIAVAMALLWSTVPLIALVLFLALACVHFAEDWEMLDEPLLRIAAGAAIIAAATIGHQAAVARLFVAMSDERATLVARIVTAVAPVTLLLAAVGIGIAWQGGSRAWAAAMTVALALLMLAPPVLGFALFFVFLHSPRHLMRTRTTLHDMTPMRWCLTGVLLSVATLTGWWILQRVMLAPDGGNWTADAFQLLASIAVPHLLLSRWMERRLSPSQPRQLRPYRSRTS